MARAIMRFHAARKRNTEMGHALKRVDDKFFRCNNASALRRSSALAPQRTKNKNNVARKLHAETYELLQCKNIQRNTQILREGNGFLVATRNFFYSRMLIFYIHINKQ